MGKKEVSPRSHAQEHRKMPPQVLGGEISPGVRPFRCRISFDQQNFRVCLRHAEMPDPANRQRTAAHETVCLCPCPTCFYREASYAPKQSELRSDNIGPVVGKVKRFYTLDGNVSIGTICLSGNLQNRLK